MPRIETGPRAKIAALAIAGAELFAACGGGNTPATAPAKSPIPVPSETASPTLVIPSPEVIPSLLPTPEATPTPTPEITQDPMPSAKEVLDTVLNQPNKEIKAISIDTIKTGMRNLWKNHQDSLSVLEFSGPPVPFAEFDRNNPDKKYKITLDDMLNAANLMEKGTKGIAGNELLADRIQSSVGTLVEFVIVYRTTPDISLKSDLIDLVDMTYDYGARIAGNKKPDIQETRDTLNGNIPAYYSWFK